MATNISALIIASVLLTDISLYFTQTATTYSSVIDSLCGPCGMAQQAVLANPTCASSTDPSIVCMGTCRDVYDNIISNCDASVSGLNYLQLYSYLPSSYTDF